MGTRNGECGGGKTSSKPNESIFRIGLRWLDMEVGEIAVPKRDKIAYMVHVERRSHYSPQRIRQQLTDREHGRDCGTRLRSPRAGDVLIAPGTNHRSSHPPITNGAIRVRPDYRRVDPKTLYHLLEYHQYGC